MSSQNISIIVPVYNGDKTLRQCIDSILIQDHINFELIIVNNNSNDTTQDIINDFITKDSRVKTIFEKKQALGTARNTGVRASQYEIIAMTDSDCIAPKDWLSRLLKILEDENENIVMGFQYDITKTFWSNLMQKSEEDYVRRVSKGLYIYSFDPKNFIAKTSMIKKIMFDPEQVYMEDVDFFVRSREFTKIRFTPDIQVGHYNKSSFKKVLRVNFIRAYWAYRVYKKNNNKKSLSNILLFTGISKIKILFSPILALFLFFRNPPDLAFYKIIAGGAWIAGTAWGVLKIK